MAGKKRVGLRLFLILIVLVGLIVGAVFAYNHFAKSTGNPTTRDLLDRVTQLEKENEDLKGERDDAVQNQRGASASFFWVSLAVLVFLGVFAWINQQQKTDAVTSREPLELLLREEARERHLRPSDEDPNWPRNLSYSREIPWSYPIGGVQDAYYCCLTFVTDTPAGLKKPLADRMVTFAVRSNNLGDVQSFWGESLEDVRKTFREYHRNLRGDGTVTEEQSRILDEVNKRAAETVLDEVMQ